MPGLRSSERQDRRWYDLPPAFRHVLPPPPVCFPGEHFRAAGYLCQIAQVLKLPGWTPSERRSLRNLYEKWKSRADGTNQYFEQYGTIRGHGWTVPDAVRDEWARSTSGSEHTGQPKNPPSGRQEK